MSTTATPVRAQVGLRPALRALLADGAWHWFDDLYEQVYPLIDPQVALRRYRGLRKTEIELEEMIQFGRREIVRGALYLMRAQTKALPGSALSEKQFRLPKPEEG